MKIGLLTLHVLHNVRDKDVLEVVTGDERVPVGAILSCGEGHITRQGLPADAYMSAVHAATENGLVRINYDAPDEVVRAYAERIAKMCESHGDDSLRIAVLELTPAGEMVMREYSEHVTKVSSECVQGGVIVGGKVAAVIEDVIVAATTIAACYEILDTVFSKISDADAGADALAEAVSNMGYAESEELAAIYPSFLRAMLRAFDGRRESTELSEGESEQEETEKNTVQ